MCGAEKLGYGFKYTPKRSAYNRAADFALLQLCVLSATPTFNVGVTLWGDGSLVGNINYSGPTAGAQRTIA
jgi:hypothetical protein